MEFSEFASACMLVIVIFTYSARGNGTPYYCSRRLFEKSILRASEIEIRNARECSILYMGYGTIQEIDSNAFVKYTNMFRLDILCNSIHTISVNAFNGTQIKRLDMSFNNLQCIPDLFDIRYTLEVLIMSGNNLDNCSAVVDYPSFTKFDELHTIYIDEAGLRNLPGIVLIAPNLKEMSLKKNRLQSLPNFMQLLPNISIVDLYGNRMICDCQLLWLYELELKLGSRLQFECETTGYINRAQRAKVITSSSVCTHSGKKSGTLKLTHQYVTPQGQVWTDIDKVTLNHSCYSTTGE